MTIEWIDGFDENGSAGSSGTVLSGTDVTALLRGGGYVDARGASAIADGRTAAALALWDDSSGDRYVRLLGTSKTERIVGFAFCPTGSARVPHQFCRVEHNDGTTNWPQLVFRRNTQMAIEAWRGDPDAGGVLLGTSAPQVLHLGVWQYVELRWVIDATVGMVCAFVDKVEVLDLTGQNTVNPDAAAATQNQVALFKRKLEIDLNALGGHLFDDFYVVDPNSGSAPGNTYLGDVRVTTEAVDGAGATTGLSVSGAAANWDAVDDAVPDDEASYVFSDVAGTRDLYTIPALPAGVTSLLAVLVQGRAEKTDAGARAASLLYSDGTNTVVGPAHPLAADAWLDFADIHETAPDGTALDPAEALQIGVQVV